MTVELPRKAHTAMGLDIFARRVVIGFTRGNPGRCGSSRQVRRVGGQRPGAVIGIRPRQFDIDIDVGQFVLDRLERADRAMLTRHRRFGWICRFEPVTRSSTTTPGKTDFI